MKEWVDKNYVIYKNIIALQGVFCQCGKGRPHDRPAADCRRGTASRRPCPTRCLPRIYIPQEVHAMRRIGFYLFIIAVFLLAPLLALPQKGCPGPRRGADPNPNRRRSGRRALPRCVGQLSGMGAGRFLVGGGVHAGNRHNAGQYTVDWRNSRAGAGAALRRCALPQRLLSVQPPLHRHAGAGPRV